jgi:hypothetical protein
VALFSALSRQGLGDAALTLRNWLPKPGAIASVAAPDEPEVPSSDLSPA